MSQKLTAAVRVAASPTRVFSEIADLAGHLRWAGIQNGRGLVDLEVTTTGPLRIGTQFRSTGKDGRFVMRDVSEITGLVPDREIRYTTESKNSGTLLKLEHSYEVRPDGDATIVTYAMETRPENILGRLFWPMVVMSRPESRKLISTTLARLRTVCEGVTAPSAGEPRLRRAS